MKKKFNSIILFLFFLLLVGCSSNSTNSSNSKEELIFGASFYSMNNPHWIDWSKGLTEATEKKGDKLIITDAQDDLGKQIADVEDLVTQKVDAIFIAPYDSKGIKPALEAAKEANIPVVIMDIPVEDENLVTATVSTDNYLAGKILGEKMVEEMGGHAKVGLIDYSIVNTAVQRTKGFFDVMKNNPDMQIVARQEGMASTELGMEVMEGFLQSNPEINAVFASNDMSGLGAVSAVEAAKRSNIKIFSVDGNRDALKAIKEGKLTGTAAQFPRKMGNIAVENAYKIIAGENIEKWTKVKPVWVNKSNVNEYLK